MKCGLEFDGVYYTRLSNNLFERLKVIDQTCCFFSVLEIFVFVLHFEYHIRTKERMPERILQELMMFGFACKLFGVIAIVSRY